MEFLSAIEAKNINKKFKGFELDIPELKLPKGFATAFIGENGAGKTTLLNILSGVRLDYQGELSYFDEKEPDVEKIRDKIGYTGPGIYFFPNWNEKQVIDIYKVLFEDFEEKKFRDYCEELNIFNGEKHSGRKVRELSDGNRMKLEIAGVLSRDTKCLIMDEPASPLDPLMREKLCDLIRNYIDEGDGERSVIFSTHNIADMENVTDYAVIIENGKIAEQGFVEELKEKYVSVKGNEEDAEKAEKILFSTIKGRYGFEGLCLSQDIDRLKGMDVSMETPTLHQISVAVMRRAATFRG